MKRPLLIQVLVFFIVCLVVGIVQMHFEFSNARKVELDAFYDLLSKNNSTQFNIMDNHGRLLHYIAGHDFHHPVNFCPECGMISELSIRQKEIYDEIIVLSEQMTNHPDDPKIVEKVNELTIEANLVTRYIACAEDRAKELGKIMMKRIRDEGEPHLGEPVPVK